MKKNPYIATEFIEKNSPKELEEKELLNWLRLARTNNIGPVLFFEIIDIFQSATNAIQHIDEFNNAKNIKLFPKEMAEQEIEKTEKFGAKIITAISPQYPRHLKLISDPPPILTIKGNQECLKGDMIAIVGARNASINGIKFAREIASDLTKENFVISSGLARGIDSAAHYGALICGHTAAVIGGGINNVYPKENHDLYNKIIENGILISEFPFGASPRAENFPRRNRIISGMSLGVIIVEATKKSGSSITARMAIEQNREVFAVPGYPYDARSAVPNDLIKQGAVLIRSASDVLSEIEKYRIANDEKNEVKENKKDFNEYPRISSNIKTDNEHRKEKILQILNISSTDIENISQNLDISIRQTRILLIELSLEGKVKYDLEGVKLLSI